MAFWGIEVKPGKPFTHTYDGSKGRLHISQATLGLGTTENKSIVQCNVGNSSPVFLCSLFPEKTESLQLHIEFEEGEEVVFSVIGPRSVHLTGHYVGTGRHFMANDESESYGEDIADTETERSDRSAEDTYEDSFIDDSDPINPLSSPVSEDGVEAFSKKKPKKAKSKSRRLRKKYQLSESDDDNHLQQDSKVNGKANVIPEVESGDEDFFTLSSLCKPKSSLKSTNIEAKDKVDKKASETDYITEDEPVLNSTCLEVKDKVGKRASETDCKIEDADGSFNDLEREIGCMVVEDEAKRSSSMLNVLACNTLVPSTEMEQENGTVSKKKKKEKRKKQTTKETDGANSTNILQEDQGPQDEPNVEKMHPILPTRNEQQEAASTQEADQLGNTLLPVAEDDLGNVVKSKKKKKQRKEIITLNVDGNHSNAVEEDGEQIQQGSNEKADASLNLPLASKVGSENGAKRKKKRKERSKEQATPEADNTQHNSVIKEDNNKPSKTISDKMGEEFSVNEHADIRISDKEVEQLATENKPKKKKKTKVVESEEILSTDKYC